jgi:hypothetical protein
MVSSLAATSVIEGVLPRRVRDLNPRIHIEFSSASTTAAIVRRGPAKWVRLLGWDTAGDTITPGSWFHGRIYEDGCSLSPFGTLFAYFATKYGGVKTRDVDYSWTAVFKLPWLTALALWPQSDTWGGRAKFVDNQTLIIDCPHWDRLRTKEKLPKGFTVDPRWIGKDAPDKIFRQFRNASLRLTACTVMTRTVVHSNTLMVNLFEMDD